MKGMIIFAVFLAVCGGIGYWALEATNEDPGFPVWIAFGYPGEGTIDLVWAVDLVMPLREGPKLNTQGRQRWDEWVTDHFKVYDESGEELLIERTGQSELFDPNKIRSTPEFYLRTKLQAGKSYALDYIPRIKEGKTYRHKFVAPSEQQKMVRTTVPLAGQK